MSDYPRHSAEEMKRLSELYDDSKNHYSCWECNGEIAETIIAKFLAESNLRTLAWAREQLEGMKGILWHDNVAEHTRRIHRHNTLDEAIKSLTPESL